jgi:hypothetical protein
LYKFTRKWEIPKVGLESGVLAMIRIAGVALLEVLAILVAVQFASHSLQGQQKILGLAVEIVWLLFASLNLVTSFSVESGNSLPTSLAYWLHYGLPISALVAGALYYAMMRVDPEAQRMAELKATEESHRMAKFIAQKTELEIMQSLGYLLTPTFSGTLHPFLIGAELARRTSWQK